MQPYCPEHLGELLERIRKERDAKQRDRYRAVLLALKDQTTVAIMQTLDRSKCSVQRWAYTYRDDKMDVDCWTTAGRNPNEMGNKFKNAAIKDFSRVGYIGLQDLGRPVWYRNIQV